MSAQSSEAFDVRQIEISWYGEVAQEISQTVAGGGSEGRNNPVQAVRGDSEEMEAVVAVTSPTDVLAAAKTGLQKENLGEDTELLPDDPARYEVVEVDIQVEEESTATIHVWEESVEPIMSTPEEDRRRVRKVKVHRESAAELFKESIRCVDGLPEDAECVWVTGNPQFLGVEFIVRSDTFDPVKEGEPIPKLDVTFERTTEEQPMAPGPTGTYVGYCVWCGAKHEVGGELHAEERGCMCGGQIVPTDTLARLAHRLWTHWSQVVAEEDDISQERRERWEEYWVPFDDLPEDAKDRDRELVKQYLSGPPTYSE